MLSLRSRAREVALQLLFQRDLNAVPVPRAALLRFVRERLREKDAIDFCLDLYDGVVGTCSEIDKTITTTAENWRLHRMLPSDRNVLRLGTYELLHAKSKAPLAVVLNEAIELARRFGSTDSPKFVNGILDKIGNAKEKVPAEG